MNILYLTNNAGRASTTVPTKGWFEHLIPRGLSPVLVSPLTGEFQESVEARGLPFYKLALPFPDKWRPWPFLSSLWQLRRIALQHQIQLIHCNEQDVYPIGQYLARWLGLPVVVSIHFTMGRPFCQWAFGGKRQPERIFFTSQGNLDACRDGVTGVIDPDRWRVLNNGIDLDHFRPDTVHRHEFRATHGIREERLIGVACALRPRKQIEHLFRAAVQCSDDFKVVLAGGPVAGDERYAESLIDLGRNLLGDRLIYLGHVLDLRPFYNGLDIYVNTSQEEACSLSILECMACACPVVGYSSKTVHTQILPNGGEITPQDDVNALARALQSWLASELRLGQGRIGARRRVEESFDTASVSCELFDEYESLIDCEIQRNVA